MSAGLAAKFDREFIASQFDALLLHTDKTRAAHQRLLRAGKQIKFQLPNDAAGLLQDVRSERVIFAGSQFGPPLVSLAALASAGLGIAVAYWALSETRRRILENCRIFLIDMTKQESPRGLIRLLRELQAGGYYIWLMCDAQGKSRTRYDFLGYSVRSANLIEVYSRICGSMVIPTYCRLISDAEVSLHFDAPITHRQGITQLLLSKLDALICGDPINYTWNKACIVFSDPRALQNGLYCLPDFLAWRGKAAKSECNLKSKRTRQSAK